MDQLRISLAFALTASVSALGCAADLDTPSECADGKCDEQAETVTCVAEGLAAIDGALAPTGILKTQVREPTGRLLQWDDGQVQTTYTHDEFGAVLSYVVEDEKGLSLTGGGTYTLRYSSNRVLEGIDGPATVVYSDDPNRAGHGIDRLVIDMDYESDGVFEEQRTLVFNEDKIVGEQWTFPSGSTGQTKVWDYDDEQRVRSTDVINAIDTLHSEFSYREFDGLIDQIDISSTGALNGSPTTIKYSYSDVDDGFWVTRTALAADGSEKWITRVLLNNEGKMVERSLDANADGEEDTGVLYSDCYRPTKNDVIGTLGTVMPWGEARYALALPGPGL